MRKSPMLRVLSAAVTSATARTLLPRRCLFSNSAASTAGGVVAMKKVTKSNFLSALEELRPLVRASDFIAVDLEMTGVTSAPWREAFEFDRSDVRYSKVKDSAEKFAVVQFGVCPFRWDITKGTFAAHPHNFYIFPRAELSTDRPCDEFHCQTSSINFLAKHHFDFNACIYEGISYLSRTQETEALNSFAAEIDGRLSNSTRNGDESLEIPLVRTADVLFTERMKITFHDWRKSIVESHDLKHLERESSSFKSLFPTTLFKMRPAVTLSGFSSHQQRLIRRVIKKNFDDLVYISTSEEKKVVYVASKEDEDSLTEEIRNDFLNKSKEKLKFAVGFREVIDLLSSEGKLLVGHNCFLDFAHVYSKFIGPLPSSIGEFASALHINFGQIIDTRHILKANPVIRRLIKKSSTSLSSAFSLLCPRIPIGSHNAGSASSSRVQVEVEADASGSCSGTKHEAGYDAFMTGCIFAEACSHLGVDFNLLSASSYELAQNPNLQNHINRLYPSWNGGMVINLQDGEEIAEPGGQLLKWRYPKMIFDHTIILWGFSTRIKPRELKECLERSCGSDSITSIFYLDSSSALVQFSSKELAVDFLVLKETLERSDDAIRLLHPLSRLLEGGRTCAGSYEIYKELCCSPFSKPLIAEQAEAMGIAKSGMGHVGPAQKDPHHVSCDDILDSLYASHA